MRAHLLIPLAALVAVLSFSGCRPKNPDVGRPCDVDDPCPAEMHCLADYDGMPVCMESCTDSPDSTCFDGALCVPTSLGERACWVGGPVEVGGVCEGSIDCAHGGICISVIGMADSVCRMACTIGRDGDCFEGERCIATLEGDYGFCGS